MNYEFMWVDYTHSERRFFISVPSSLLDGGYWDEICEYIYALLSHVAPDLYQQGAEVDEGIDSGPNFEFVDRRGKRIGRLQMMEFVIM